MRTKEKFVIALAALGMFLIPIVAAYTFTLNEEVVLQGTTFDIDDELFKYESGEHYVNLDDIWYELDDNTYSSGPTTITMLTDVECDYFLIGSGPGSHFEYACCQEGGGSCGG